jgi:hypothetical protein
MPRHSVQSHSEDLEFWRGWQHIADMLAHNAATESEEE